MSLAIRVAPGEGGRSKVVVSANDQIKALLGSLKERAEIRDERDGLMGHFVHASVEAEQLRRKVEREYDATEVERRKNSGGKR